MHLRGVLALVVVLAAACSGGSTTAPGDEVGAATQTSEAPASPAAEAAEPTVSETTVADPTAVVVQATDDELIAAAVAKLDAVGASDLVAWDVLESSINGNGEVQLTLCGWTGDTVFDAVYRSRWKVEGPSGEVSATELTTSPIDGECLNTELVDSALAAFQQFEAYWAEMTSDPSLIASEPRTIQLLTESFAEGVLDAGEQWEREGISFAGVPESQELDDRVAELLFRRFRTEVDERVELVACRNMISNYGIYRGDVLLDNGRSQDSSGLHSLAALALVRQEGQWKVITQDGLVWTDCRSVEDWPGFASEWRPEVVDFGTVEP